ncbi:MAG: hypothetical protein LLG16_03370 [Euryarchaeota archaeon]|nr:hypothetical protein [Euryarchaeota archaeon]
MATKRKLNVAVNADILVEENKRELTWKEWAKSIFLKYYFMLFALIIDSFISLEIESYVEIEIKWAIIAIFLLFSILAEALIYVRFWGKDGIWNFDNDAY